MGTYIPDLTERFPEGFGGVDLTDKYFPEYRYKVDPFEYMEAELLADHSNYWEDEEDEEV